MTNAHRALRFITVVGSASIAALVGAACSSSRDGVDENAPPPFNEPDSGKPQSKCGRCSPDLKKVLEGCEGEETRTVLECGPDQGCGDGTCVDACTAAAINKGSTGCDFWTLPPADPLGRKGSCFAAMIANTWDRPINLSAEYGTSPLDISKATYTVSNAAGDPVYTPLSGPLPVGQVAVVFLSHNEAASGVEVTLCPTSVTPAMLVDPNRYGTGKGTAFHLKTDAPVSAYSSYPYGGADSQFPTATLLLPVSSWEKNYVAIAPYDFDNIGWQRILQIVANEDDTEITIRPTVEVSAGADVAGATTGVPQTWKINRGQVLQFSQRSMAGSPISTTKPVGVFGGSGCTELGADGYCDILFQQVPPFAQWGNEYAFVPFKPRIDSFSTDVREKVPYTIIGGVDGTELTYEPSRPRNAPDKINAGETAQFYTDEIFVVRSQDTKHPFYSAVYMTSALYGNGTGKQTLGDPDFVNLSPTAQFLDRYVIQADYTFSETSLTLVRRKTASGFKPVELECAGEVTGWKPIGSGDKFEFAWVKLTTGFVPEKFPKGECGYGRHEVHSDGPFGVTVWGIGIDASYGYVGGMGLRPVNDATPPVVK